MAEGDGVLRQKLAAQSAAPPGQMSAEKAIAIAFGRAAREVPGLGLRLAGFSRLRLDLAEVTEGFEPGALGMLLVRRGAERAPGPERHDMSRPTGRLTARPPEAAGTALHAGLLVADPGLVAALVEARMTGHVAPAPPPARQPTRIDALIVAGLVDAAMAQFDRLVTDLSIAPVVSAWRAGATVPGVIAARLTLREGRFVTFALDFDLGEGARQGRLLLAMPEALPDEAEDEADPQRGGDLAQIVLQTRGDLRAVLARMQVPLSRLSNWRAGHTIPIPRAALGGVRIEDIDGGLVGHGRLGQLSGSRAIRISDQAAAAGTSGFSSSAETQSLPLVGASAHGS